MAIHDDELTDVQDEPDEAPRRRRPIEDELDTVDPLFDLDESIVDKQRTVSPGTFVLLEESWRLAPEPYLSTDLPDPNINPAGYMLGQLCGLVDAEDRDAFAEKVFDAYNAERLSLASVTKITERMAKVFQNREQRRTGKRAGRPTGAR